MANRTARPLTRGRKSKIGRGAPLAVALGIGVENNQQPTVNNQRFPPPVDIRRNHSPWVWGSEIAESPQVLDEAIVEVGGGRSDAAARMLA